MYSVIQIVSAFFYSDSLNSENNRKSMKRETRTKELGFFHCSFSSNLYDLLSHIISENYKYLFKEYFQL